MSGCHPPRGVPLVESADHQREERKGQEGPGIRTRQATGPGEQGPRSTCSGTRIHRDHGPTQRSGTGPGRGAARAGEEGAEVARGLGSWPVPGRPRPGQAHDPAAGKTHHQDSDPPQAQGGSPRPDRHFRHDDHTADRTGSDPGTGGDDSDPYRTNSDLRCSGPGPGTGRDSGPRRTSNAGPRRTSNAGPRPRRSGPGTGRDGHPSGTGRRANAVPDSDRARTTGPPAGRAPERHSSDQHVVRWHPKPERGHTEPERRPPGYDPYQAGHS